MPFDWLVIPALFISYGLFWLGYRLAGDLKPGLRLLFFHAVAILAAVPGILIALYYLHWFDFWTWFYEFRSRPGSELTAAGMGLLGGMLAYWGERLKGIKPVSTSGLLTIMSLGIILPHAKPVLAPVDASAFADNWDGAVCLQTTLCSCGPACAATILRHYGVAATEAEIARECFTYKGGTENWYIARAFRRRGLDVHFLTNISESRIPAPSIAGVRTGGQGHFIAIIEDLGDSYRTGDPLIGERVYRKEAMEAQFQLTGFFMPVSGTYRQKE